MPKVTHRRGAGNLLGAREAPENRGEERTGSGKRNGLRERVACVGACPVLALRQVLFFAPTPRDFHIPTAPAGRAWKSGKPNPGFPLSHTRPATMTTIPFPEPKPKPEPNPAAFGGPRTSPKRRASRSTVPSARSRFQGSPRIGNETRFQAHYALETNIDFRLIYGLENAPCMGTAQADSPFGATCIRCIWPSPSGRTSSQVRVCQERRMAA